MKKLVAITGIILLGCLFVSAAAAPQATAEMAQSSIVYNEKGTIDNSETAKEVYILKAENGKLVVYIKGESVPYFVTDTTITSLPRGDILRLEKGIEISGYENLKKSIEDYCS